MAPISEGMTANDATMLSRVIALRERLDHNPSITVDAPLVHRILATHAALAEKTAEVETLRLQLAGCGVAAMQDLVECRADRLTPDSPYWSASYGDVCRQVDALIACRAALAEAQADSAKLREAIEAAVKAEVCLQIVQSPDDEADWLVEIDDGDEWRCEPRDSAADALLRWHASRQPDPAHTGE